ncbi:MORC family CW-type zinc finger protein 1 [Echinops telfairi]|uniref:MORC family CW-type zinc finger protein 1 n=1 Tax=Echinops telfairi TaxID=9371 RepID=A0AC55CPJ5_ECHTE|nr:MORC family CW-type zinc finger protein 1 [Echinops telfairi]
MRQNQLNNSSHRLHCYCAHQENKEPVFVMANIQQYRNSRGTTHSFLFGALAELLDNARDAGAARLDVFSVGNEKLQGGFMLCFLDDGCGMSPEETSEIIYFGTSKKRSSAFRFIGQYGNGLKSGAMRIGKDFILFTKKEETMTCLFFSQTFCETEGLSEVVVPIPSWLTRTRQHVTSDPIKFSTELAVIYKYSPFKTEAELMQQFDMIYGKCGSLLVIYNVKLLLTGEPELDVKTDQEDIRVAGAIDDFPEKWSFRAYTSILYFDPWMRIFIQAKRVRTKHLYHCLYRPRKYLYVTASFRGTFRNEVKKAEEAVKFAKLMLKEAQIKANTSDRTSSSSPAEDALRQALEDVEEKLKTLKEKQRELKQAKTLPLFYGVSVENRSQVGMFIYSNSRLIKMHEKVGPQMKVKSLLGAGVVGIVNIPLEIMEPSHNKQEFLNVREYTHLLKVMGQYLVQYCKDTGISNRNLSLFWNDLEYQNNKDVEQSLDFVQYQRRQAMAMPLIIQCDLCLKWRVLPSSANYQEKDFLDIWICANNPNPLENSCHQKEWLPSIPLGTMNTALPSKSEKEKQLRALVHKYQNKPTEQQPQLQFIPPSRISEPATVFQASAPKENTRTKRSRPSDGDLDRESLPSLDLSISHTGWKRHTEGHDSDIEFVSETKITRKTMQKKVKRPHWRGPGALPENVRGAKRSQASSWEMKRKHSQNLMQECTALIEVETNNENPDRILLFSNLCVCDQSDPVPVTVKEGKHSGKQWCRNLALKDSRFVTLMQIQIAKAAENICIVVVNVALGKRDTDISFKQEEKEVPLVTKENPELCSVVPKIQRNSSLPNSKSGMTEDSKAKPGCKAGVPAHGDRNVASSPAESFPNTPFQETKRKLMSNLRKVLQYFFPEYQLSPEFDCIFVEDPVTSSELEQCPEHMNTKLKMCFNQIQNVCMVQYEKKLKSKMQSIISDAVRREEIDEVSLRQCEEKRKRTEDKLKNLRVKLTSLLQKLHLGDPSADPEQIDSYLEALLKEDNLPFQNPLNKVTIESGHNFLFEKK